jgi:predicted ATPase
MAESVAGSAASQRSFAQCDLSGRCRKAASGKFGIAGFLRLQVSARAQRASPRERYAQRMTLPTNTRLGQYEIKSVLGAGGMGEVYLALDTRLNREVAIKILPGELSADVERLRRFEHEACTASALNHPNIVTIFELGQDGPNRYISMELVKGRSLRDLLASGMLPIRRTIEIAAQVAEGLTNAHEAGIAHRDLKPENLMISHDDYVKILDFGLAKSTPAGGDHEPSATSLTAPGTVMGTAEYMSPEQVSGRPVDFRSDQFSFGLVLYEMVTGKHAFRRGTAAETMTAILREPAAPIGEQNPEAPAPLCWAIERCMAKEPEKRYASTRDLALELAAIRTSLTKKLNVETQALRSNLPAQRTGFVGRESEVAAARGLLQRDDVRLVTITGPGGIGKTRLALQIAEGMRDSFPGGIYFVPLSSLSDAGLIESAIAQSLGIREGTGQSPLRAIKEGFHDVLRRPTLLLLDNFEHLMEAAPVVAELLTFGPKLRIVVTSRAALHLYGERELPVLPLAMPDAQAVLPIDAVLKFSAVALFVQRAAAARPDFELNRVNASAVTEICARLDGLPLAIELAAARVKVLSPSAILTRLSSRLQLLTGGSRDLPERHQTLRAAMDWSYDLLSAAEQKLFRRMSVFVGGCNLEGIEAVCDARSDLNLDLLDGIASLVDKSLVRQIEEGSGESRFRMLQTIREYAIEKLAANGEEAFVRRAHAAYCVVLAEEDATDKGGTEAAEWLERLGVEYGNFRAALEWLIQSGDAEWGLRLGTALFRYWEVRELLSEGRDRLSRLLQLPGAASPTKLRMRALFAAGVLASVQGDYDAAETLIHESQDLAHQLGDKMSVAVSLNAQATFAKSRGDVSHAEILFEASLELWRELGDPKAVARALSNLANVLKMQGSYDRARSLYAECLGIFRSLGDMAGVAWSLNYQGDVACEQGDSNEAKVLYERSLAIFREIGEGWGIAGTLADLGNLAREQRDYPRSHKLYTESLGLFQELNHKRGIARLLECFAITASAEGNAERALKLAGAAAALRLAIGVPLTPAEQARLESSLNAVRQALASAAEVPAWLAGWNLPLERAVEEALTPEAYSRA